MQNGVAGHLMKASAKRRRSKAQILEDKALAMKKEAELHEKLEAWNRFEAALEESEKRQEKTKAKYDKFKQVFDDGLVKKNAQALYETVIDPNERA